MAREEVSLAHLAHLIRMNVPDKEIKQAAMTAHQLGAVLEATRTARKEMGRERMPQVVYTTEEWKQLKEYRASTTVPVKDDHAAARLQAGCVIAGAELRDVQGKADAFQASKHFWKLDVEGWDRGLSLKEVEQAIKAKSKERLKIHNFLRPSKREAIQGQIDYLQGVKKEIQKGLAAREADIAKNFGAAQVRFETATNQVEQVQRSRSLHGKGMPPARYEKAELARMSDIAARNKDAHLLGYVYEQVRDRLLENARDEALSRAKGRSVMAKLEMLKEAERFRSAAQFGEYRQLPRTDGQGLTSSKSIKEVAPKNALETLIRHFSDSAERKGELRELTDVGAQQIKRAEEMSIKARDYSVAVDRILADYCRVSGVSPKEVAPSLNAGEIAELRDFSDRLSPFSSVRKDFNEAARLGERKLLEKEPLNSSKQLQDTRPENDRNPTHVQSRSPMTTESQRSDRDSFSRGR